MPFLLVSPHLGSGRFWLLWTTIIILTGIPPNFLTFKFSIQLTREQATTKAGKAQWKLKVLSKWFILSPFLFQSSRNGKDCSLKIVRKAKNAMWVAAMICNQLSLSLSSQICSGGRRTLKRLSLSAPRWARSPTPQSQWILTLRPPGPSPPWPRYAGWVRWIRRLWAWLVAGQRQFFWAI